MTKLLPGNETVVAIPAVVIGGIPHAIPAAPGAPVALNAIGKAVLDPYIARRTLPARALPGGNISEAIQDNMQLGLTGSERSTARTITSIGRGNKLTFFNFQANLTIFRDADEEASGAFNLARVSFRAQDIPYILCKRLGARHTVASTIGEDWSFFFAHTGQPIPAFPDGGEMTIGLNFVPKNIVRVNSAIGA